MSGKSGIPSDPPGVTIVTPGVGALPVATAVDGAIRMDTPGVGADPVETAAAGAILSDTPGVWPLPVATAVAGVGLTDGTGGFAVPVATAVAGAGLTDTPGVGADPVATAVGGDRFTFPDAGGWNAIANCPRTCEVVQLAVNVELTVTVVMNDPPKHRDAVVEMFVATFVPVHALIVPDDAFPPTPIRMTLPATDVVTATPIVFDTLLSVCCGVPSSVTDAAAPASSK
jgi:hypothetical protein